MHLLQELLSAVAAANPALLWVGAALLPLVGVPVSPLWIALGIRLGPLWGATAAILACTANITVGFWLARSILQERIATWLKARGRTVPSVRREDERHWILLLRVAPGLPLFMQNYLLALAGVRFSPYLALSIPVQALYAILFASLGHSLTGTSWWRLLTAMLGLAAAGLVVALIRRHLRRHAPQS